MSKAAERLRELAHKLPGKVWGDIGQREHGDSDRQLLRDVALLVEAALELPHFVPLTMQKERFDEALKRIEAHDE